MNTDPWYSGRRPSLHPTVNPLSFLAELEDQPWADQALCSQTDPEAFFPEKGGSVREAKAVCATCDVRTDCLAYALAHGERFGIWGGLSERERRRLQKGDITQPRPCAREGCPETIPLTASAARRYHNTACGIEARDQILIATLDPEAIVAAYQAGGITVSRLAARHKVTPAAIARILDEHHVPRRGRGGHLINPPPDSQEAS